MFTQFYVLGPRGDSIIYRNFRNEITKSTAETFFRNVRFWNDKPQEAPPIFNIDGLHYMWVKRNNLYFVFTSVQNVSPCAAMEMLVRIMKLMKDYCGVLTEEAVRANFTLVYELLDEVIDYGYPQATTTDSLKAYVFNESVVVNKTEQNILPIKMPLSIFGSKKTASSSSIDKPINSRDKQHSNDVYVDIFERVSLVMDSTGAVISQAIDGTVQMKSYLMGSPELMLGVNEDLVIGDHVAGRVCLDDCNFHECVQHDQLEDRHMLVLKPREGEFTLMNYRVSSPFKPPFRVFPYFEVTSSHRAELIVKVRCDIPVNNHANQVVIDIPMPACVSSASCDSSSMSVMEQHAEFDSKERVIKWRVTKFTGGTEATLRCRLVLSGGSVTDVRKFIGPISMLFEIPLYSATNFQVKFLRLTDSRAPVPQRWVRYITRASSYVCRM
jgi:AP-4 complex subunit mu-1